jgi:hypothetical protein
MTFTARSCCRVTYKCATNTRGSRWIVTENRLPSSEAPAWKLVVSYDHGSEDRHGAYAAQAWLDRFIPGATLILPGLSYGESTYFGWTSP